MFLRKSYIVVINSALSAIRSQETDGKEGLDNGAAPVI